MRLNSCVLLFGCRPMLSWCGAAPLQLLSQQLGYPLPWWVPNHWAAGPLFCGCSTSLLDPQLPVVAAGVHGLHLLKRCCKGSPVVWGSWLPAGWVGGWVGVCNRREFGEDRRILCARGARCCLHTYRQVFAISSFLSQGQHLHVGMQLGPCILPAPSSSICAK